MRFRLGIHRDAAFDAAQPPKILALEIGTVAPLEDLQGDEVFFTKSHKLGDVELGVGLGVLTIAHKLPVHPKVETGLRAADIDDYLLVSPRFVNVHPFAVTTHGVAFHGHLRQLAIVEVIGGVHIDRHTVSVQLPVARHRNGAPIAVIEVCAEEIGRTFVGIGHIEELPHTIQPFDIEIVSTLVVIADVGPRVKLVHLEHGGVLPFGEGLGLNGESYAGEDKEKR